MRAVRGVGDDVRWLGRPVLGADVGVERGRARRGSRLVGGRSRRGRARGRRDRDVAAAAATDRSGVPVHPHERRLDPRLRCEVERVGVAVDRLGTPEDCRLLRRSGGVGEIDRRDLGETALGRARRRDVEVLARHRLRVDCAAVLHERVGEPVFELAVADRREVRRAELLQRRDRLRTGLWVGALRGRRPRGGLRIELVDAVLELRTVLVALEDRADVWADAARAEVGPFEVDLARDRRRGALEGHHGDLRERGVGLPRRARHARRDVGRRLCHANAWGAVAAVAVVGELRLGSDACGGEDGRAVHLRVDDDLAVGDEHLRRRALDVERRLLCQLVRRPRVDHLERTAVEHVEVLPVVLDDVRLVDALHLGVRLRVGRRGAEGFAVGAPPRPLSSLNPKPPP